VLNGVGLNFFIGLELLICNLDLRVSSLRTDEKDTDTNSTAARRNLVFLRRKISL
jgi:hypothetical protein